MKKRWIYLFVLLILCSGVFIRHVKHNAYYFDIYVRDDIVSPHAKHIIEGDILALEYFKSTTSSSSKALALTWRQVNQELMIDINSIRPERRPEEIVCLRQSGLVYVLWEVWFEGDVVLIEHGGDGMASMKRKAYDALPRR